jgi:hypothetical protein
VFNVSHVRVSRAGTNDRHFSHHALILLDLVVLDESRLVILTDTMLEVCRIKLTHHLPFGFHGIFTPHVFMGKPKARL